MNYLTGQKISNLQKKYHFVGIGGIGMSGIAQILRYNGDIVSGSDRDYDKQTNPCFFSKLSSAGISLWPQDGSGIDEYTDFVVVSSAIEEENPDIIKAHELNTKIIKRANLLAGMFNSEFGIAVGGTNGKTTVSSMIGYILDYTGRSPTIIVGGCIRNYVNAGHLGNARPGESDIITIEADESDGSIVLYTPKISVITNISKDHKPVEDVSKLFKTFSLNTSDTLIINADCPKLKMMDFKNKKIITYGLNNAATIKATEIIHQPFCSQFVVNGVMKYELNIPGIHNISNALAAISVAKCLNAEDADIASALKEFKGIHRRMEIVGEFHGVTVIDDYAHNPEKVKAAITSAKMNSERVIAIFQPHGFGPTNFMRNEFIDAFVNVLSENDTLFMPEIYYAGGTASKNISSADIIREIHKTGRNAFFIKDRKNIIPELQKFVRRGDCILLMGARDNTLSDFCREIALAVQGQVRIPLNT